MSSVIVSGDTSGAVTLSAPAVAGTVTVTLPATSGTMLTTASTTGISGSAISSGTVAEAYGGTGTTTGYYGFKNRIINGAMVIDQRNAGASVAISAALATFITDRFNVRTQTGTGNTSQQSTTAPSGFTKSLLITIGTGATPAASDGSNYFRQVIEGVNVADLAWSTASAATVTLSFWVRSSLTGQFGGSLQNNAGNRSYPFTYTINSANTYEYKTITIAGDQSGTWVTDTTGGLYMYFDLGVGSNYLASSGSWAGADYRGATGDTKLVSTSSATFYITGVQLEKGSTATSFDYRPYGTELQLCQRYFEHSFGLNIPANGSSASTLASGGKGLVFATQWGQTTTSYTAIPYVVPKRATPVVTNYGNSSGYLGYISNGTLPTNQTTYTFAANINVIALDTYCAAINNQATQTTLFNLIGGWSASAEL